MCLGVGVFCFQESDSKGFLQMGDPFSPLKPSNVLAALLRPAEDVPPAPTNYFGSLAALSGSPLAFQNALYSPPRSLDELVGSYTPPALPLPVIPTSNALTAPAVKRMAYFAFDFDDVIRVNNV